MRRLVPCRMMQPQRRCLGMVDTSNLAPIEKGNCTDVKKIKGNNSMACKHFCSCKLKLHLYVEKNSSTMK
jgi:hypothetical protein